MALAAVLAVAWVLAVERNVFLYGWDERTFLAVVAALPAV